MDIRRIAQIKVANDVIGGRTRVKVVKNKVAAPFREAEFDLIYGEGISYEGELVDMGADKGVIEKMGSWYSFKDMRIGQGRENAKLFLKENVDVRAEVAAAVKEKYSAAKPAAADEVKEETTDG